MASGAACHSSSGGSAVPMVVFGRRAGTRRCCRPVQVAHSSTVGECSEAKEPRGARGGATAAQGVHEGSAKVRFQRGGIAGSVLAVASLGPTSQERKAASFCGWMSGSVGATPGAGRSGERFRSQVRELWVPGLRQVPAMYRARVVSLPGEVFQNSGTPGWGRGKGKQASFFPPLCTFLLLDNSTHEVG